MEASEASKTAKHVYNKWLLSRAEWVIKKLNKRIKKAVRRGKDSITIIATEYNVLPFYTSLFNDNVRAVVILHFKNNNYEVESIYKESAYGRNKVTFTIRWGSQRKWSDEVDDVFRMCHQELKRIE